MRGPLSEPICGNSEAGAEEKGQEGVRTEAFEDVMQGTAEEFDVHREKLGTHEGSLGKAYLALSSILLSSQNKEALLV